MKFVFPLGFTFTGSVAYTQYIGFTNDYDDSYLLCNAWIGKKIFKNKRGEIMFGVNDLLNRNKAFARTTGSGWTQNATNSVIGRYYMVQFTYNLRRFGKKGSKNISDYDGAPPHGTRRSGRAASGYLPRSAVTGAVRTKKTSGAMPDVFFVIMPEACFRFVLVPVCRADGRPFLRTGRGGSCGCLGVAVTFPVRRCAAPGCRPCPRG